MNNLWYVAFAVACFTNLSPAFAGVPDKPYAEILAGKKVLSCMSQRQCKDGWASIQRCCCKR